MDKKSPPRADQPWAEKTLLAILLTITTASIGYTFYKTVVKQNFEVVNMEEIVEEEESALDEPAAEGSGDEAVGEEETAGEEGAEKVIDEASNSVSDEIEPSRE
jgi:hypothetical protein